MTRHEQYETLLYQYELLRTRLRIREHYLGTVVKEVYENIGQVLSLIRIKLLGLQPEGDSGTRETLDSSGELVGKTISDLRQMCRLFYPEEDIMHEGGFHRVLSKEIQIRFPAATYHAEPGKEISKALTGERGILLFGIILEIFAAIEEERDADLREVEATFSKGVYRIGIGYTGSGKLPGLNRSVAMKPHLSTAERVRMLGGKMEYKSFKNGTRKIILDIPINEPS